MYLLFELCKRAIIRRLEPFILRFSPIGFRLVQMRRILWQNNTYNSFFIHFSSSLRNDSDRCVGALSNTNTVALSTNRQKSSIAVIRNSELMLPRLSYVTQKLSGRNIPNRFTFLSLCGNISTRSPFGAHPYGNTAFIENVLSSPKYRSMRRAKYNCHTCFRSFSLATLSSALCLDLRLLLNLQNR